jgi:uncharacterized LabA/DUF88 family protein
MDSIRVAVFIDNSNIFHNIRKFRQSDPAWTSLYNPLTLAEKLTGNRKLVYVGFYCVRPPSYLLGGGDEDKKRYRTTVRYYSEVEKLPLVEVKYGDLKGTRGSLQEKNVDTQLSTDMVTMAALDKYDTAILISNDGDYVSAVGNTKQFSKKIEVVFFRNSLSMALRKVCDLTRRARRPYFESLLNKSAM